MNWIIVNWYIIIAIVSAFLLGWAIGIWIGTSKGYAAAIQEQAERMRKKRGQIF